MYYADRAAVNHLATTLLQGLCVKNPTPEQCKAAESFVTMVILPPEEKKGATQEGLTRKEWLCLNLAASGLSTEETAEMLALAKGTIKNYRERIRQKLHCKSITQAVYKAFVEEGNAR
jgi:ATP/maltotriose-dependent transcriptional regulator MalT